jgi:5'-deoxynucleotidase
MGNLSLEWEKVLSDPANRKTIANLLASADMGSDLLNSVAPKVVVEDELKKRVEGQSVFMALLYRMNSITRWTKSQCIQTESLNDHSASVAFIGLMIGAHYAKMNPNANFSAERLCVYCLFHDAAETLGEDLNGVLKGSDPKIRSLVKQTEGFIAEKMAATLDPVLAGVISPYFLMECTQIEKDFVKAADLLSALAKAKCELRSNNADFVYAAGQLESELSGYMEKYPSVKFIYEHYTKAYDLTIDELITFLPLVDDIK